jgi:hypothetical protein
MVHGDGLEVSLAKAVAAAVADVRDGEKRSWQAEGHEEDLRALAARVVPLHATVAVQ